ncbi:thiamine pyrophosphate-binding protein [Fodinicurvata halophila]|uniref:Thiamine pyrophosphate-binding protein n=1 Tax=Fodinicurvata halophila TaxID=1419723 RepID=A0ABV8UNH4_9PROT
MTADDKTNRMTGAEAFVRVLQHHGVKHIFGLCGDTSLPLYDALHQLDHGMTHILTRDERSAAYMADVYARLSGRVGVCEGPSGGGATYILPGLVEADESSIPVLGITTDIGVGGRGKYTLTELDQDSLFKPVTKWNKVIDQADQIPNTLRQAFRQMTTGKPGAAHIGLPFDVQKQPVNQDTVWADETFGRYPAAPTTPDSASLDAAAELLLKASNPLIICGGGPLNAGASQELTALAEALGAPVATSISGKGVISERHPLALGVVGSNGGSLAAREVIDAADLVLLVGCRAGSVTTERWRHPQAGSCKIVHVDADPGVIGANYRTDVAVIGDARPALKELLDRVQSEASDRKDRRATSEQTATGLWKARFEKFDELAAIEDDLIRPERIIREMQELLPRDSVIVADPGTPCPYVSAYYRLEDSGRRFVSNRAHGALGYAMPGALGACYARPNARVVAFVGDGSFGFNAGELETLVRMKAPITVIVASNAVYGWIKAGQKSGFGERYFSVDFDRTDHARVAEAFGLKSWSVKQPGDLRGALKAAFEAEGPTLVDVITQPLHEANAPVSEWVA